MTLKRETLFPTWTKSCLNGQPVHWSLPGPKHSVHDASQKQLGTGTRVCWSTHNPDGTHRPTGPLVWYGSVSVSTSGGLHLRHALGLLFTIALAMGSLGMGSLPLVTFCVE